MRWVVVYIALDANEAESIHSMLSKEGLLVRNRLSKRDNDGLHAIEILVPSGEADEALEIINTI